MPQQRKTTGFGMRMSIKSMRLDFENEMRQTSTTRDREHQFYSSFNYLNYLIILLSARIIKNHLIARLTGPVQ